MNVKYCLHTLTHTREHTHTHTPSQLVLLSIRGKRYVYVIFVVVVFIAAAVVVFVACLLLFRVFFTVFRYLFTVTAAASPCFVKISVSHLLICSFAQLRISSTQFRALQLAKPQFVSICQRQTKQFSEKWKLSDCTSQIIDEFNAANGHMWIIFPIRLGQ